MVESSRIPWARISAEGAVIVVSILLAFSIDAWWENRTEREAELWLLDRLHSDFSEIQSNLEIVRADHQQTYDACVAILDVAAAGEPLPLTPEVDRNIGRIFLVSRTFNPGSGAVAVFLNSSASRLVRNQPLADLLVQWSGIVEDLQEEEAQLQKGVSERWTPYLAGRGINLGPYLTAVDPVMTGMPQHVSKPAERTPLIVDAEFLNHVISRYTWQKLALRDLAPLERTVEEILGLLDDEATH